MFKQIRHKATAYFVLGISFLFTLFAAQYLSRQAAGQARLRFEQLVDSQQTKISERLENRITLLRSTAGLFSARSDITARQFRTYVARLELDQSYPDVQAIGYSFKTNHENGDAYPIIYLEPKTPNNLPLGFDLLGDPLLRPVLEQARDSRLPAISVKQSGQQDETAFVICLPIYRQSTPLDSVDARPEVLEGFILGFIRLDAFIRNSLGTEATETALRIYDGEEVNPAHLLHSVGTASGRESRLATQRTIAVAGGTWTLVFAAPQGFSSGASQPWFALFLSVGVLVSTLLFLLTRSVAVAHFNSEDRAEQLRRMQEAQQQLNAQLEQHRTKLKELISQVPGVVWEASTISNGILKMTFISDYVETMLGYSVAEWIEEPDFWLSIVHPEDRERAALEIKEISKSGTGTSNFRWIASDGRVLWVETHAAMMLGNHGEPIGLRGVTMDITARHRAEEILRDKETRLQIALSAARMASWQWDLVTGNLMWDDASNTWVDFVKRVHPEDQSAVLDAVNDALREQKDLDIEFRLAQADIPTRWVTLKARVFQGEDGRPAYVTGVTVDITDRIKSREALRASEERYRLAARATNDAIWDWDLVSGQVEWNEGIRTLFGYAAEQVSPDITWRHSQIHPEDKDRVVSGIDAVIKGGGRFWSDEYRFRCANGLYANVTDRAYIEQNESGQAVRLIAAMTDVTRLRQADRERDQLLRLEKTARKHAESASRMKDEFLATVSHELRTPITPILGWVQLLRRRSSDAQSIQRGLDVIERNARAQARLIEDLLDVSRIITGKMQLNIKNTQIQSVIQGAIDSVQPAADSKGVRIETAAPPSSAESGVDPDRLQQVVWNLLSNAIKFTPAGGVVRASLELKAGELRIVVADNGEGIDPEFLPHVFERFSQADSTSMRFHGGLGIGLAIVRSIVELHGGHVTVESPGKRRGSTFTVILPTKLVETPTRTRPYPRVPETQPNLKGLRVLMVDDEPDTLQLLAMVLQNEGAKVTTAPSAEEAIGLLRRISPDILISDIAMPGENGYALLEKVRRLEQERGRARVPAIALTAYAREEDRQSALEAGFETHMAKPIEPEKLVALVLTVAARRLGKAS